MTTLKRQTRMTAQTAINKFINYVEINPFFKPSTIAGYKTVANRLYPLLVNVYLKEITAFDIEHLLNVVMLESSQNRGEGYNTKTRSNTKSFLKLMFEHYYKRGDIRSQPFSKGIKLARYDDTEFVLPYTKDEVGAVLALKDGCGVVEGFEVTVNEGLRPGELIALTSQSYNKDAGYLQIDKSICLNHLKAPKTVGSKRRIMVTDATKQLIEECIGSNDFDKYEIQFHRDRRTVETFSDKFVFYNPTDGSCWGDSKKYCSKLAPYFKRANVHFRGLNPARHTFITNAVNAGISFQDVADHVGHSNVTTLKKHYFYWQNYLIGKNNLHIRNALCTY
ncbi:tyrosine-type recombinase/integrase [Vibrio fluvialis]|nr:tyrosine-type recombinase/integrase [Vibrio fluvialis]